MFGIDVTHDSPEIHPIMFCHTCRNKAQRGKKKWVDSTLEVHEWKAHVDGAACATCAFFTDQAKGGRHTKATKNRGRPNKSSARYIADTIQSKAPSSWMVSEPLLLSRFLPPASNIFLSDMQCGFCKCIVDQPVKTPCRKLVCAKCISDQVRASNAVSLHCPLCSSTHTVESTSYTSASDVLLKIIGSL